MQRSSLLGLLLSIGALQAPAAPATPLTVMSFYIVSVHLNHESQPSRERSAALQLSTIPARDPKAPAVVTGDFDAGEDNPATKAVRAIFHDSSRVRHHDATEVGGKDRVPG